MGRLFSLILPFILLFLLYFGFNLYGINTRYVATGLLVVAIVVIPTALSSFTQKFKAYGNRRIIKSLILYTIVAALITLFHATIDMNVTSTSFRLLVFYIDCLLLSCLISKDNPTSLIQLLLWIFVAQSFVILAAFISPSILEFVRRFQYEDIMIIADRYLDYGTFRGLALSGDQFHGLTVAYGFVSIIAIKEYVDSKNIKWILMFLLFFVANMFVGRTGFVGFALALVYLIWSSGKNVIGNIIKISVIVIGAILVVYQFLPLSIKSTLDDSVFRYAFQLFYNYQESGRMETSTTDRVQEMWREGFTLKTFLVGDGLFVNNDGSYYRHVDVGYLRQLFYGGVFFLIYSILLVWRMLVGYAKKIKLTKCKLEIIIWVYLLVVHTKGLDFMSAAEPMLIVFIYYIHQYINKPRLQICVKA